MKCIKELLILAGVGALIASQGAAAACKDVSRDKLATAINTAANADTGGYGLPMWITFVDETGKVCEVLTSISQPDYPLPTFKWGVTTPPTGEAAGNDGWLGSRVISAQKANTANAFSIDDYVISTANLYTAVQPGNSLYGLQHSNPVDASQSYGGSPATNGTKSDFLKNKRVGGVNVFGGGLALYKGGKKIGAIGVSGDTSCRDHAFAWQVRGALTMHPASGAGITTVNMDKTGALQTKLSGATIGDEMILNSSEADNTVEYWDDWSQPTCPNSLPAAANPDNGTIVN